VSAITETVSSLRPGDLIEITYRGLVTEMQPKSGMALRITCDDGFMDHYYVTDVESLTVLKRAPFPEPPIGSIVRCNGCGARHYRLLKTDEDGRRWVSQDDGTVWAWDGLNEDSSCGQLEVVFTP
jgi:hypothetical protein